MGDINKPSYESEGRMNYDLKTFLFQFFSVKQINTLITSFTRLLTEEYVDKYALTAEMSRWFNKESMLYGLLGKIRLDRDKSLMVIFPLDIDVFISIIGNILRLQNRMLQLSKSRSQILALKSYKELMGYLSIKSPDQELREIFTEFLGFFPIKSEKSPDISRSEFEDNYKNNEEYKNKLRTSISIMEMIRANLLTEES